MENSKTAKKTRRAVWMVLAALFTVGLFLRLYGTERRGVSFYDEAFYLVEATTFAKIPSFIVPLLRAWPEDKAGSRTLLDEHFPEGFFPSSTGRPGFVLPLSVAMLLDDGSGYAALVFPAAMGSLGILAAYLLVFAITKNAHAGLGAAALLAFLPYHVLYSRVTNPHTFTALLLTLAAWAYTKSFEMSHRILFRWLFLAGLLLGYALTTHVNVTPIALSWFLFETVAVFWKRRADFWGRLGVFSAGFIIPIVGWEVVMSAKGYVLGALGSTHQAQGYLSEYFGILREVSGTKLTLHDASFYLDMLRYLNGNLFLAAFVAGAALLFFFKRARELPVFFLLYILAIFTAFYSLSALRASRTYVVLLPLAASIIATAFYYLCSRLPKRFLGTAVFFAIIGGLSISFYSPLTTILGIESGYRKAAEAFRALPENRTKVGFPWIVFQWYLKERVYSSAEKPLAGGGGDFFIVDGESKAGYPREAEFERAASPLMTFANPVLQYYPFTRDLYYELSRQETLDLIAKDPHLGTIRIYKL